jgi:hypothetical protein
MMSNGIGTFGYSVHALCTGLTIYYTGKFQRETFFDIVMKCKVRIEDRIGYFEILREFWFNYLIVVYITFSCFHCFHKKLQQNNLFCRIEINKKSSNKQSKLFYIWITAQQIELIAAYLFEWLSKYRWQCYWCVELYISINRNSLTRLHSNALIMIVHLHDTDSL